MSPAVARQTERGEPASGALDQAAASGAGAPAAAESGPSPIEPAGAVALDLAGERLALLPAGAAWHAASRTLVVADLHLEKASSLARRGQLLPPYDSAATLARLAALVAATAPARVVALGDSFHDRGGPARLPAGERALVAGLVAGCDWVWILGNHDPEIAPGLGGRVAAALRLGGLTLRHAPIPGAAPGEVAGHLHPVARVAGHGRAVRRRCFAADAGRLVLPAFGSLAGGLNVLDAAFSALLAPAEMRAVVIGRTRLYPVAAARLVPG